MKEKSGLTTAGMVLGIIAIVTCFLPIINNASFVLGILALIFGIVGLVKKTNDKGKAITAVVLGILSIFITLSLQSQWVDGLNKLSDDLNDSIDEVSGDKTDELLENDVGVTIGTFEVIPGEWFDETKLPVTIKNKTGEKASYSISIDAIDSEGNRIDDDVIYANDLTAGQSQTFEIFTYVEDGKIEQLKTATFRVIEVSKY